MFRFRCDLHGTAARLRPPKRPTAAVCFYVACSSGFYRAPELKGTYMSYMARTDFTSATIVVAWLLSAYFPGHLFLGNNNKHDAMTCKPSIERRPRWPASDRSQEQGAAPCWASDTRTAPSRRTWRGRAPTRRPCPGAEPSDETCRRMATTTQRLRRASLGREATPAKTGSGLRGALAWAAGSRRRAGGTGRRPGTPVPPAQTSSPTARRGGRYVIACAGPLRMRNRKHCDVTAENTPPD